MAFLISRPMAHAATAAAILVLCLAASASPQTQPPKTDTTRGLSIQYADGRVSTGPVRRTGGMWTATFPRIDGAETSRNGLPLTTLAALAVGPRLDGGRKSRWENGACSSSWP